MEMAAKTELGRETWSVFQYEQQAISNQLFPTDNCKAAFTHTHVRDWSGFPLKLHLYECNVHSHLYKHITQRVLNEIELRKCFAIKTTIFHQIANNFMNHTPLMINNFTMTSFLTSNMCHSFCKLYYCYLGAVYFTRAG